MFIQDKNVTTSLGDFSEQIRSFLRHSMVEMTYNDGIIAF